MGMYAHNRKGQERPATGRLVRALVAVTAMVLCVGTWLPPAQATQLPSATARPDPGSSGGEVSSRIVGGSDATIEDAPWQVALLNPTASASDYLAQKCGGSIVAPTWILTAAHCVYTNGVVLDPQELAVLAGETTLLDVTGQRRDIVRVIPRSDYDPLTTANDAALLELAEALPLDGTTMAAIDLPTTADPVSWPAASTPALITGWGNMSPDSSDYPHTLQKATVAVLTDPTDPVCGQYGADYQPGVMLCAGAPEAIDTCQGDSGGPLAVQVGERATLAGITSWGTGCAQPGFPGVYTRVTAMVGWLTDHGLLARPTFDIPVPTADGFTVNVANYDPSWTWTPAIASPAGAVVVAGTPTGTVLPLQVTGLAPEQAGIVTVTTTRPGYTSTAVEVTGSALTGAALAPVFSSPVSTADGFTVNVTNFDPAWTWSAKVLGPAGPAITAGSPVGATWPLTVTGLAGGQAATLEVTASRSGHTAGAASVAGSALVPVVVVDPLAANPGNAQAALNSDVWVSFDGIRSPATVSMDPFLGQLTITGPGFTLTLQARTVAGQLILPVGGVWTFTPGQVVALTGSGLKPNSQIQIHLFSEPITLAVATADAAGGVSTEFTVPAGVTAGVHVVQVNGWNSAAQIASSSVRAQAAPVVGAKSRAISHRSRLKVTVAPKCADQYKFRVMRRTAAVTPHGSDDPSTGFTYKMLAKVYKTAGKHSSRTVNLPKGTYRAHVIGSCGQAGITTDWVTLKR